MSTRRVHQREGTGTREAQCTPLLRVCGDKPISGKESQTRKLWVVSSLLCLILVLLLGCTPRATPIPTPTTTPTSNPTAKATSTPLPTASPTSKPPAIAAPVSFANKIITMIVVAAPGGGSDIWARLYVRYLAKYLPGEPSVIIRNIPAGGGMVAANYAYTAKPDGLTILMGGSVVTMAYALRLGAVRYDLQKMDAIVATAGGNYYIAKTAVAAKVEDLPKATGIVFGYTATGAGSLLFVISTELLGIHPQKVILAYGGGGDARRAYLSGEINMTIASPEEMAAMASEIASRESIPLFQTGILDQNGDLVRDPIFQGIPELANLPTAREVYERLYGKPPSGMAWDAYRGLVAAGLSYRREFYLTPGMPASIAQVYRDAVQKMLQDPEFRKNAVALGQDERSPWFSGEAFSKQFKAGLSMEPQVVDWTKSLLAKYGVVIE